MKQVIIMRGPPGAGKSTLILDIEVQYDKPALVCSADHFFYFGKPKKPENYKWNPKLIGKAHNECRERFKQSLAYEEPLIIVDNTNIKERDFRWYIEKAIEADYNVAVHTITGCTADECFKSNVHSVPKETIQRMIDTFADTPDEINGVLIDEFKHDFHELRKFKYGKSNKENKKARKRLRHVKEAMEE